VVLEVLRKSIEEERNREEERERDGWRRKKLRSERRRSGGWRISKRARSVSSRNGSSGRENCQNRGEQEQLQRIEESQERDHEHKEK